MNISESTIPHSVRYSLGLISLIVNIVACTVIYLRSTSSVHYRTALLVNQAICFLLDVHLSVLFMPTYLFPLPCTFGDGVMLHWFDIPSGILAVSLGFSIAFCVPSYGSLFLYRYQAAMGAGLKSRMSNRSKWIFLSAMFLAASSHPICLKFAEMSPSSEYMQKMFSENTAWNELNIICYKSKEITFYMMLSFALLAFMLGFIVTVCIAIFRSLSHAGRLSEAMRVKEKAMTRTLIVQSSIPILVSIIPIIAFNVLVALNNKQDSKFTGSNVVSVICFALVAQHSVVHAVVLVLSTPSYRNTFTSMAVTSFGRRVHSTRQNRGKANSSSVVRF